MDINSLIASLQAFPDNWQTRQALVQAFVDAGQLEEATKVLSGVTELPADIESQVSAGKAYGALEPASGIEILDRVLTVDPSCAPAHLEKARLLVAMGDTHSASTHYHNATQLLPSLADAALASTLGLVPSQPATRPLDRSNVYYPAPHEYPTVTLEEALAIQPVPLVNPAEIPSHPEIAYQQEVQTHATNYTKEAEFLQQVNNVDVNSAYYEQAVSYDYQQPDDSLFKPTVSASDIYVGAMVTEDGTPVASLHESIQHNSEEKELQNKKAKVRDTIVSFATALLALVLVCVGMVFIVNQIPRPKSPALVASSAPIVSKADLPTETLEKPQVTQTPAAPAASFDVVSSNSASSVAFNNFDTTSFDTGFSSFDSDFSSASMSFGSPEGSSNLFGGSSGGALTGYLYDLKTDRNGKDRGVYDKDYYTTFTNLIPDMKRLIRDGFSEQSLSGFKRSEQKLSFQTLAIPSISATVGPESFSAPNIKPSAWIAVYRGKVSPDKLRLEVRFLGDFDDVLYVFHNGKMVLDGSVNKFGKFRGYSNWNPSERLPTINQKWGIQGLRAGPWIRLRQGDSLTIVVGEIPGGAMRGTLMVQEKGVKYKKGQYAPFVIGALSGSNQKRMAEIPGITFEDIPVVN